MTKIINFLDRFYIEDEDTDVYTNKKEELGEQQGLTPDNYDDEENDFFYYRFHRSK